MVDELEHDICCGCGACDEAVVAELEADRNLQFATRRERIATAALAAFLSADSATVTQIPIFARWAVKAADALIAELDREPVQGDGR